MATRPLIVNRLPAFVSETERRAGRAVTQALVAGGAGLARLVPVDTSTLLNSQYRQVNYQGGAVVGRIGFTAEYALAVHEASGKLKGLPRPKRNGRGQGVYWGPSGEPRFLEKSFEEASVQVHAALRDGMRA